MSRKLFLAALMCLAFVTALAGQEKKRITDMLELPAYSSDRSEQVIFHYAYTVSFNLKHRIPNWVAWELEDNEASGEVQRGRYFYKDPDVKGDACPDYGDYQYKIYKYERGHMCPAADNKWSEQAMKESFYMSNMCPQKRELNGGSWNDLEEACRKWAKDYGELYIVAGPVLDGRGEVIGEGKITAPERFFKAVMRKKGNGFMAIAYVFDQQGRYKACSVDEVEDLTGLDLFHNLPDKVERIVEKEYDAAYWTF